MATSKKTAKKATKKTTAKIDFSDSINAIKGTAKTVNAELKNVVPEVTDDLKNNSKNLREVITTTQLKDVYTKTVENVTGVVTDTYEMVTETVNMENISATTKKVNDYTLKTAEEVVEGALNNGEKLQGIANKAVKGGLKLASKQQDIMFDTLEDLKKQFSYSADRFVKLFSKN